MFKIFRMFKKIDEVKDCTNCRFREHHISQGECWDYCSHKKSPESYGCILWGCQENPKPPPKWCPLNLHVDTNV